MGYRETRYDVVSMWAVDFWIAFLERPKFIRFLVKILMGRYAWNELIGMKKELEDIIPSIEYRGKSYDYHNDLDKYKDW